MRFCSPLAASVGPSQDLDPPHRLVLPVPCPLLTCSLYSLRFRMTAVICWSMKMRMVTRTAGTADTRQTHHGLAPKGKTIQPRAGFVGCGEQEGHGSCHPLVGCAVQLGDGTSPRCPGWSPIGTRDAPPWEWKSILTHPGDAAGQSVPPALHKDTPAVAQQGVALGHHKPGAGHVPVTAGGRGGLGQQ